LTPKLFWSNLAAMQTLGLSGESQRSDGRLKSIFWPTVQNAWDVDSLGRQGFWICVIIAAFELAESLFAGNGVVIAGGRPIVMVIGVLTAVAFIVGGMGVRESNWPAAAMVFAIFFMGILYTMAMGRLPGILSIFAAAILLSNLRAAFLASEWRPAGEGEDKPTRFNETLSDKLADQLPAKAWPVLQIPFFALAALLLLLNILGLGFVVWLRLHIVP
jgi:hypothetical protein